MQVVQNQRHSLEIQRPSGLAESPLKDAPIPIALIGAGGVGQVHLGILRALHAAGKVRFIAVADPVLKDEPLKRDLEALGIRWYQDFQEMLRCETSLKAVTIATPIPLHFSMARACIERGLFVLMEKPPVPLLSQLDELIALDQHQRVSVCFQMAYMPAFQRMKQSIANGELGTLKEIRVVAAWPRRESYYTRANWAGKLVLRGEPVFDGPATNGLAHLIHNIMYLAAPGMRGYAEPGEIQGELYRARQIEGYDVASLRGRFQSGITFSATLTHAVRELLPFKIEARGTGGWARITDDGKTFENSETKEHFESGSISADIFTELYRHFLDATKGEASPMLTRLRDTRGYVLATNGMWSSSGGIHDIDRQWLRPYQEEEDAGLEIVGFIERMNEAFATGKLLSELEIPWAHPSTPVSVCNLRSASLGVPLALAEPLENFQPR